jgi:pectinesterase
VYIIVRKDKQGWGAMFSKYLLSGNKVTNLARGGTSTKTFIAEGDWKKAVSQKADFVFIQFGHNDQNKNHTQAGTTYKANLRKMIADIKKYGGIAVIVSSPRRLHFDNPNRMSSELTPFAVAAREVAAEEKVPFVDLHEQSKNIYIKLGEKEALKNFVNGDRTHTIPKGADLLASLVATECAKDPVLRNIIK